MRCPACGASYPPNSRFCTRDGTRLEHSPAPAPKGAHAQVFEAVRRVDARQPAAAPEAAAAPVDFAQFVGQVLDDRYRVARKIGEGGMSFVYLADDERSGDRVAIKILSPALSRDANAMARLKREADLAGKLAHPNVCHIVRLGETPTGLVYVVMPYLEGELLCDRTNREGQLAPGVAARFVSDIAAGLQAAHDLGIIHRDLKPENVMICPRPDGKERAVVMDFGLAKERRMGPDVQKLTATGIVLGTPEFMSPEQLRGKPLDARTDVYSLGLMTCEMLTGQLPFAGKTQQEVMLARLKGEPTPIRALRPELGLSAGVEKVLLRALQREPDQRYRTAPELASAFATAVRRGGDTEDPPSLVNRLLRR